MCIDSRQQNLADLSQLPERGFDVIALPMKIAGGTGGPLRIIAVVAATREVILAGVARPAPLNAAARPD